MIATGNVVFGYALAQVVITYVTTVVIPQVIRPLSAVTLDLVGVLNSYMSYSLTP